MTQGGVRDRPLRCGDQCYLIEAWPQSCRVQAPKSLSLQAQRHTEGTRRGEARRGDVGRKGKASSGENLQEGGHRNISVSILSHTHS